jgi:phosphoribosylformylglycinamidine cyclo-ligase
MPPKRSSKKAGLSYKDAGVDIDNADAAKRQMATTLKSNDKRLLNTVGAFASLFDGRFPGYDHPVLVLKTEEPGSKQLLAFQHGRVESVCQDMINHLVNDIIVMGATPLCVQDAVICGKLEKDIVTRIVAAIADACKAQGCVLTGGETSEQPGMLEPGRYVLTSSIIGVAEKAKVIDGSAIKKGDVVIAVASNGLHTNGYTLVRALMKKNPKLIKKRVDGDSFLDVILRPHTCYYQAVKDLFKMPELHGMAHITGGGIHGNLNRILPKSLDALIDLTKLNVLPVFTVIQQEGNVADSDMLRTYNMGVGMTMVVHPDAENEVIDHLKDHGHVAYPIGTIVSGSGEVRYTGKVRW